MRAIINQQQRQQFRTIFSLALNIRNFRFMANFAFDYFHRLTTFGLFYIIHLKAGKQHFSLKNMLFELRKKILVNYCILFFSLTAISRQADIESPAPSICFRAYSLGSVLKENTHYFLAQ